MTSSKKTLRVVLMTAGLFSLAIPAYGHVSPFPGDARSFSCVAAIILISIVKAILVDLFKGDGLKQLRLGLSLCLEIFGSLLFLFLSFSIPYTRSIHLNILIMLISCVLYFGLIIISNILLIKKRGDVLIDLVNKPRKILAVVICGLIMPLILIASIVNKGIHNIYVNASPRDMGMFYEIPEPKETSKQPVFLIPVTPYIKQVSPTITGPSHRNSK